MKNKNNKILFTTPSHGGHFCCFHKFYKWYKSDISEVDAYNPQEALYEAEKKAADVYGTKYTKFLTNGSTSGIISAVLASGAKTVALWDDAHRCHSNAVKLSGAKEILYSLNKDEKTGIYKAITQNQVEYIIKNYMPDAIIITSPTYEGNAADVENISMLCHKNKVKLIVDEAHGALYPFSDELPTSAVKYADYTVQSLHKTAGGINPTALLHSNDVDPSDALSKINTTSPSYPMLATIESNIRFLNSKRGRKCIEKLISNIKSLDMPKYNDDVTKIILKKDGLCGYELSEILYNKYNIEDEKTNEKSTMLLCGIGTSMKMLNQLKRVARYILD